MGGRIANKMDEMTSRERILAAINHQPVDRVPTDIWAVTEVREKLTARYGSWDCVREKLHIDGIAHPWPDYIGPPLPAVGPDERVNYFGIRHKAMKYANGVYWEQSLAPLAEAQTIDDLEKYQWPSADWFDYAGLRQTCIEARKSQALMLGYMAPFTYHLYLRGLQNALMDPLAEPEFTRRLLERLCDFFYEQHVRILQACEGLADLVQVTDDYGMQTGPIMGLSTFREFYRPHLARFCELAHRFGCKVFHHDDGAIRPFIPDLIEIGVDVLNPIQWPCPGMEQEGLKRDFGGRLCFHGGIDNQRILPFGTEAEVRAEVRHNIDALASDRTGYILAPCHNIQANTPMENIVAMYDEAHRYGNCRL